MSHSAGLHFVKLDLHVHTPGSNCFVDKTVKPKDIVDRALASGLAAITITDHNSGAWVDDMKTAAAGRLVIFPGCEITCMGGKSGVHLIAIFDPDCSRADVEGLLAELQLMPGDYGDSEAIVQKDPINAVKIIRSRGALAVLAHANSSKGALSDMQGQQRTKLIQMPELNAAEATDFKNDDAKQKHRRVVDLLDGSDATFKRKLAVYQASDNPADATSGQHGLVGIGTRCAYFKLDHVNLEGLRQCFADSDVRIRQDFEFTTLQYPRIKRAQISGGFFNGADALFHGGLNSILGAKGAGKSLLIEFLRFALGQPPINSDIREDHDGKLRERLQQFGTVEVTVCDETGKDFTVKRTYNPAEGNPYDPPVEFDISQVFPVLFLSQGEIIKIAEDPDEQIRFIDRFFDFRLFQRDIEEAENELEGFDTDLAEGLRAVEKSAELDQALKGARLELQNLDEALKNPIFEQYTKLETKSAAFRDQMAYIAQLRKRIAATQKEIATVPIPQIRAGMEGDQDISNAHASALTASTAVAKNLTALDGELTGLEEQIKTAHSSWVPAFEAVRKQYEEAVQNSGGDYKAIAQRRAVKVKEVEQLNQGLAEAKQRTSTVPATTVLRNTALASLQKAYKQYTHERRERCKKIEEESAKRLTVTLHEASNVDAFRNSLLSLKKGSRLREADVENLASSVSPHELVEALIAFGVYGKSAGLEALAKKAKLEPARLRALAEVILSQLSYEDILRLDYSVIPQDRPEIRYQVAPGRYEPLKRLSVGQKCTAMLIIALSDGRMPIIIDQPEDSLDIRTVWDDICTKIRRGKEQRQFAFTTHNSSLAVASDSDKFLIIVGDADQGQIVFSGSMDHKPISNEVLQYLEGGVQTYRRKYDKYRGDELLRPE